MLVSSQNPLWADPPQGQVGDGTWRAWLQVQSKMLVRRATVAEADDKLRQRPRAD